MKITRSPVIGKSISINFSKIEGERGEKIRCGLVPTPQSNSEDEKRYKCF